MNFVYKTRVLLYDLTSTPCLGWIPLDEYCANGTRRLYDYSED